MGRSAFSRGRPASIWVVFINLGGACASEGKAARDRVSLTWPYVWAIPAVSLPEGRTTPSRRLPMMKTTRFLAGPPDICAHPGIGAARDKSPDPLSPLFHSLGASAAAIGDGSPSRLSPRVRKSPGWRLSRSPPWLIVAGAPYPSLLVALHNPGRKALGLCA